MNSAPAQAASPTARRISDFLAQNRLALIGVSKKKRAYSRALFTEFRRRGYDMIPVNPTAAEIDGEPCFASIRELPGMAGAIVLVPPDVLNEVLLECAEAEVPRLWIPNPRKGAGREGVAACRARGIEVIYGFCPLMFFSGVGFLHRFHGFIEKRSAAYRT